MEKAKYELTVNFFSKRVASNSIRYFCDITELDYALHVYPGILRSTYLLKAKGTKEQIQELRTFMSALVNRLKLVHQNSFPAAEQIF
jgi:hypothetical protein